MGLDLDFVKGDGPRIGNPVSTPRDVDLLAAPPAEETMAGTLEAIRLVRAELESRDVPVIGFAGAPFTLASYAIEGGASKDFAKTKAFMLSEPAAWKRLLGKLDDRSGRLPARTSEGGSSGTPGLRLVGRAGARPGGLSPLRRTHEPRALRCRVAGRCAGDQLLARGERVPGRRRGLRR